MLKNNYFEFETKITQQISGTAIGTKFAPPYACLFMDRIENDFFDSEVVKPWLWLRYMDDMFFIWTEGEDKPEGLLNRLDNFHPNLKLTHEKNKSSVSLKQIYFVNPRIAISFPIFILPTCFCSVLVVV